MPQILRASISLRRGAGLFLAAVLVALAVQAGPGSPLGQAPASAEEFFPTDAGDLIIAVGSAGGNGQDDVIDLGGNTITLTMANNVTDGPTGLPSVAEASTTLTIRNGTIARDTSAEQFRILRIASTGTLVLEGVTILDGSLDTNDDGGGILNDGTLTLTGSTVSGNSTGGSGVGGGIYNSETGTLTLNASTVAGNFAGFAGGGIYNEGTLVLENGSMVGPLNETFGNGAGIYNAGGEPGDGMVTLTDSTVIGNISDNDGGGIANVLSGEVALIRTTVTQNSAEFAGGGIYNINEGRLTLTDSTVSNNAVSTEEEGWGGGIYSENAFASLQRSTVGPLNRAEDGGGIFNEDGSLVLTNSTVSGNIATGRAGGISNLDAEAWLLNTTVANNSGPQGEGGGIFDDSFFTVHLVNSIVAANSGGDCAAGDEGEFEAEGVNLDSDGSCRTAAGSNVITGNADLGFLTNNGGFTQTHALQVSSDAIDAGDDEFCTSTVPDGFPDDTAAVAGIDQRSEPRPADGNGDGVAQCDIGAFELQPPAATLTVTKLCPAGAGDATFEVQLEGAGGATAVAQAIACGATVILRDLAPGDYTLTEALAGPDAGAFATGIACADGLAPVEGATIDMTLEDGDDTFCVVANSLGGANGDVDGDGIPDEGLMAFLISLDFHLDNQNLNLVEIDNVNENDNANTNANENENQNDNANTNDNVNTNTQDQTNEQTQDNENEQTNNIDASPEVNIE